MCPLNGFSLQSILVEPYALTTVATLQPLTTSIILYLHRIRSNTDSCF